VLPGTYTYNLVSVQDVGSVACINAQLRQQPLQLARKRKQLLLDFSSEDFWRCCVYLINTAGLSGNEISYRVQIRQWQPLVGMHGNNPRSRRMLLLQQDRKHELQCSFRCDSGLTINKATTTVRSAKCCL
jgi:hypothetical protein